MEKKNYSRKLEKVDKKSSPVRKEENNDDNQSHKNWEEEFNIEFQKAFNSNEFLSHPNEEDENLGNQNLYMINEAPIDAAKVFKDIQEKITNINKISYLEIVKMIKLLENIYQRDTSKENKVTALVMQKDLIEFYKVRIVKKIEQLDNNNSDNDIQNINFNVNTSSCISINIDNNNNTNITNVSKKKKDK